MRIATWNVNSIKARLEPVLGWLKSAGPDVLLLQEIKCETPNFPALEFKSAGYEAHALGQKSYNGVAILSRHKIENVMEHLPEAGSDAQARYIEATIKGVRIASIYLPNGNPMGTEKYEYKLAWLKRLHAHMAALLGNEIPVVLGGDYNVIPEAVDVYNPKAWENDALYHPKSRAAWHELMALGYTDAFRALHPQKKHAYTFWDYQAGSWQHDNGLRIDHFLLSPEAADRLTNCFIDRTPRGQDKASDHTPVVLELAA
jgi:exodeoxyribonuclease-3